MYDEHLIFLPNVHAVRIINYFQLENIISNFFNYYTPTGEYLCDSKVFKLTPKAENGKQRAFIIRFKAIER